VISALSSSAAARSALTNHTLTSWKYWHCGQLLSVTDLTSVGMKKSFTERHTHTHPPTHTPFNGPFFHDYPGTRKVKPIWILLKQEWQWHQLGHIQVCTSLQTHNHASTPPLSFLQAGCLSCRPTNSVKALKA